MGLDTVELVLRTEEVFAIELRDYSKLEQIHTVGDLYLLVCEALNLTPVERPTYDAGRDRLPRGILNLTEVHWTPEDTWATLVAIFVDQLQVRDEEVTFTARIQQDLGCD